MESSTASLRTLRLIVAAAVLVAVLPFWLPRYVPSNDGPQHLLAAHMAVHFGDRRWEYARFFEPNPRSMGPVVGDAVLELLLRAGFAPEVAAKLFLTLWAGTLALALAYLGSWRRPTGALCAVPGLLTVHGLTAGMGFWEYLASLPLALLALGVVARDPALGGKRALALAMVLLLLLGAHPFTLIATLPALAALVQRAGRPIARLAAAAALPMAGALWVALTYAGGTPGDRPVTVWAPIAGSLAALALEPFGGIAPTGWPGLVAAGAVLLLGFRAALAQDDPVARRLLATAAAGAAITLATPSTALHWSLLHQRFPPLAWLLAIAAVGAMPPRRWHLGAALCGAALLAQGALAANRSLRIDRGLREYVSAASAVPRGARLLPLDFDPRGESGHPLARPYLHAWAYLLMERGGMTPYVFATLPIHAFRFHDRPGSPTEFLDQNYSCPRAGLAELSPACREYHAHKLALYARRTDAYDAVLTWKAPPELEPEIARRGFVVRLRTEHLVAYVR